MIQSHQKPVPVIGAEPVLRSKLPWDDLILLITCLHYCEIKQRQEPLYFIGQIALGLDTVTVE